ncbi:MAG: cytochrome b/b6 domain-containing protein [Pseudomonadota bacterium]
MPMKSTETRYGAVAVTLHWVSALLILALVVSGFRADALSDASGKAALLSLHVPLGVTVLVLTLLRLAWWAVADRKPPGIAMPRWQDRASRLVHLLFYVVILGTAASGVAMIALSGAAPILLGNSAAPLPNFHDFTPRAPHGVGALALIALFVLHAGAALYHHFVKRDGLLVRMWFGRT